MKRFLAAIGLVLIMQAAWAIDLDSAKSQGLVGEANNGYLAAVKMPASGEVRALIQEVNAKRRAEFQLTADKTGATRSQVALRFYELAVKRTARGNFYQDTTGRWQTK